MEAYDKLLESWLTLVQEDEHFPRGCFVQPAVQVFNSYIQCHLAAPDGTRNLVRGAVYSVCLHSIISAIFPFVRLMVYMFPFSFLLQICSAFSLFRTHNVNWQSSLSLCPDCKWCCISRRRGDKRIAGG